MSLQSTNNFRMPMKHKFLRKLIPFLNGKGFRAIVVLQQKIIRLSCSNAYEDNTKNKLLLSTPCCLFCDRALETIWLFSLVSVLEFISSPRRVYKVWQHTPSVLTCFSHLLNCFLSETENALIAVVVVLAVVVVALLVVTWRIRRKLGDSLSDPGPTTRLI